MLGAVRQVPLLAGQKHGRTILLADSHFFHAGGCRAGSFMGKSSSAHPSGTPAMRMLS